MQWPYLKKRSGKMRSLLMALNFNKNKEEPTVDIINMTDKDIFLDTKTTQVSNQRFGKLYWRLHYLIEVDGETGESKTIDFATYPAKDNDWMVVRHKKRNDKQTSKKKRQIKLPEVKESEEEII